MNKEDYFKYYIQGSEHYLIPKDIFDELFDEMVNWRKESKELNQKYLNAVADYETTMSELQELKKQLEEYKATNKILSHELTKDKVLQQDCLTTCCGIPIGDIPKLITQQKEFINYMMNTIENITQDETDDEEIKGYLIQRGNTFKEILSKYKSIIGGKDEDNKQ